MLKVGSKFYTFDELSRRLEEFQQFEQVQLWVRDSRTVVAAAKRARRKSLNPALKYAELTYSCVFGGRRPSDQTKTHNQTSAGGCPFKVRLSTSNDGQALVVKEICHDHNHEPGKKLHEEPRRLYRNKTNNKTTVRKQVRCVVNKQRADSGSVTPTCLPPKSQNIQPDTGVVIRLAQSPFHNLQLHNQQQQLQIKIQLENHLQQQRIKQKQLEEVIHFDSPDHIDTPDHLRSPDLTSNFESLGNIFSPAEQYSYLPPSPISPSSSVSSTSQAGYTSEEEGVIEPIVDLDVALEEALGDLDSVSSMDLEDKFSFVPIGSRKFVQSADVEPSLTALPISSSPSTSGALASHHDDDPCAPPPTKRFKGRPRKQSFTGNQSEEETDFIGFSPVKSQEESAAATNTSVDQISEHDITHANNMAKQLHVYKPGIDFVSGAKLECLDARDNKWYHCKIVEVDWGELDILVHYERWSVRFDEWLKMDSTRIRPLSLSKIDKNKLFKVGEKVLGFWAPDSCYYLGEIIRIPSEDHFEVLFYDGYTKTLRSSQLKKTSEQVDIGAYMTKEGTVMGMPLTKTPVVAPATPEGRRKSIGSNTSVLDSPPTTPVLSATPKGWAYEPEVATSKVNIFSVEILEAKRKTKRKPDVEELFNSLKKKRKLEEMQEDYFKPSSPMGDSTLSSTPEAKHRKIESSEKPPKETDSHAEGQPQKEKEETSDHINLGEYKVPQAVSKHKVTTPKRSDTYFEINLGEDWKKIARKRQNSPHWDVFYINPIGTKINNRLQLAKNAEKYPCPVSVEYVDFSYRTAKLEFEAKYGGVLIKQDTVAPSTEASFSEIYEAPAEPFGGKKINIASNELSKNEPPESITSDVEDIDAESSSASSASYSSADDGNDDTSESEDAEEKSPAGEDAAQEADEHNSSSGTDEYSDSEMESRNDKVPSVRLSEFLPESDMKEDQIIDATLQDSNTPSHESPSCLSPQNKTSRSEVTTPVVKREPREDIAGTLGSQSVKEKIRTPPLSKGAHPYITRRQSIGSPAVDVQPKAENNFQCPQKSCEKSFRKENLLQMHMKHYHPELSKKDCLNAPNISVLANARIAGDQLDSVSPSSFSSIALPPISFVSSNNTKSKMHTRKATRQGLVGMESKKELTDTNKPASLLHVVEEEFEEDVKGSDKSKEGVAAMEKVALEANETKTKGKLIGMKPAPIYSETYSLRTRMADSVSESVENEEEATDVAGDSQSYEEAIINCICKSTEEDGLMLQCDICLCWQHAGCYNIENEAQVPESYTCSLCDNPKAERSSKRFRHNQDWLKEGKLPRFPFCTGKPSTKLQSFVKRGHELSANVYQLTQLIHSLRLKLNISKAADHPKFVMWHKKWETTKLDDFDLEGETDVQSTLLSNLPSSASVCSQIKQGNEGIHSTIGESETALLAISSSQKVFLQNLPVVSEICLSTLPLDGNAISVIQRSQNTLSTEVTSSTLPEKVSDIDTLKENKDATDHKVSIPLPSIGTDQFYSPHIVCNDTQDNLQCISGTLSFSQSKFESGQQSSPMIEENLNTYRDCPVILDSTTASDPQTVLTPGPEVIKYTSSSEENLQQDSVCMSMSSSEDKNIAQVEDRDDKETSPTLGLKSPEDIEKSMDVAKAPILFGGEANDDLKSMPIISSEASETKLSETSNIAESKLNILTKEFRNSNSLTQFSQATLPVLSESKSAGLSTEDNNIKNSLLVINEADTNSLMAPTDDALATDSVVKSILEIKPVAYIASLNFAEAKSADLEAVNTAKGLMTEAPEIKASQSVTSYVVDSKNNLVDDIESRPVVCDAYEPSPATVCNTLHTMENIATEGNKEKITVPNLVEAYSLDAPIDSSSFNLTKDQLCSALKPVEKDMELENSSENVAEITDQTPLVEAPVSNRPSCSVVESTSSEEIRSSRESDDAAAKMEVDHKFAADDPETDPAVSLDDEGDDFKFELGVSGMNDVPDVSELLGHSSLEHFEEQPSKEIPSHHHAPIIPQAERIEPTNCKLNLLQHVEAVQNHVFQRFDYIEKELNALEAEMGLTSAISKEEEALLSNYETEDRDAATLQSRALVQLILKDLDTLKKIADFSDRKDIQ